ncbi:hypothetical protein NB694_000766 [Pantoea ananatis]|nr:hypothetical protein [Pantoea ananatis]
MLFVVVMQGNVNGQRRVMNAHQASLLIPSHLQRIAVLVAQRSQPQHLRIGGRASVQTPYRTVVVGNGDITQFVAPYHQPFADAVEHLFFTGNRKAQLAPVVIKPGRLIAIQR